MAITGSTGGSKVEGLKIIFLDIDGTLIPTLFSKFMEMMNSTSKGSSSKRDRYGEHFYPDCLKNLKKLVDKTGAKIVFTTNWRDEGLDWLINMWNERVNFGTICDITPILRGKKRGDEIDAWLKDKKIDKYVIIDDMGKKYFNKHQLKKLVNCDETIGFSEVDLEKALKIMR